MYNISGLGLFHQSSTSKPLGLCLCLGMIHFNALAMITSDCD